jgi:hypothetical protein
MAASLVGEDARKILFSGILELIVLLRLRLHHRLHLRDVVHLRRTPRSRLSLPSSSHSPLMLHLDVQSRASPKRPSLHFENPRRESAQMTVLVKHHRCPRAVFESTRTSKSRTDKAAV